MLEEQVKEAKQMVEESDIKYDEVARKLAMVEDDCKRAEERAETGENKIVDLEEELRVIGENLKALEVAEEKAQQREEEYKKQVKTLFEKLKSAESRYVLVLTYDFCNIDHRYIVVEFAIFILGLNTERRQFKNSISESMA